MEDDLLRSGIFLACQLLLLVLVLSPFLLAGSARTRRVSRTAVLPAAAAALVATAAVDIAAGFREYRAGMGDGLPAQALQGKPIILRFFPESCLVMNMGIIGCGTDFHGRYEREANRWTMTGFSRADGRVITVSATNAEPVPGAVSVWGVLGRFDESGALTAEGQQIGTVRLETHAERQPGPSAHAPAIAEAGGERVAGGASQRLTAEVFAGKPVVIRLDSEACRRFDLGTIACDSQYQGKYDRPGNRWTVTGYNKGADAVVTAEGSNADPLPGSLSVWGMVSRFDDAGIITYQGQQIGTVRLETDADRQPAPAPDVSLVASTPPAAHAPAVAQAGGEPVAGRAGKRLIAEVFAGKPVAIRFDDEACRRFDLGTVACDYQYQGKYDRLENRWTVTGYNKGADAVVTAEGPNADLTPGSLSLWGMVGRFDDAGIVTHQGREVGRIWLEEEADRQAARATAESDRPNAPSQAIPPPAAAGARPNAAPASRLFEQVLQGARVVIRFNARACEAFNLGTIACESDYRGSYDRAANRWTVTGFNKGDDKVVTFAATNAEPTPGILSVWGMVSRFDDVGVITYLGQEVGRIRLDEGADRQTARDAPEPERPTAPSQTVPPPAAAGQKPDAATASRLFEQVLQGNEVVIRFDAHACEELNLGTIACETDYRGSYDRAANRWTVTGFNKGDQNIVSFGATNADPTPGSLSVWGMVGRFDEAGTITYLDRPVGKLRPASESPGKE